MYEVEESMWISVVEMYLEGPAALWYQSIESQIQNSFWTQFCQLLHDRFDRDQHEVLIRQLFNIWQLSSVTNYITRFAALVDQLSAYFQSTDPLYFTMRFMDGLRPDLKSVVLMQRPKNLDTAYTLALLQEEMAQPAPSWASRNGDWPLASRSSCFARTASSADKSSPTTGTAAATSAS
jgi:small-conductance mechanosensitive channel